MWQESTFDPAIIDQELGWAEDLGFNAVRVFLHYLLWEQDAGGFLRRLERFLEIADRHHIGTMFVLFDDCWNAKASLGPQPAPRPGVHNSGWVQCPGPDLLETPGRWGVLEDYTRGVIGFFCGDRRVLAWDLYNEPGNSNYGSRSLPLLKEVFAWARTICAFPAAHGRDLGRVEPSSPSSTGSRSNSSDIISFHSYRTGRTRKSGSTRSRSTGARSSAPSTWPGRPGAGSRTILPLFKAEDVGAMNWGFVSGKTQTIFPWGSKEGSPEPQTGSTMSCGRTGLPTSRPRRRSSASSPGKPARPRS